jgi:type VI protein secretion system component VasF
MRLADLFMPLMAFTTDFESRPRGSVDELLTTINELIHAVRNQGFSEGVDNDRLDEALFPVVAWMDERFLSLRAWDSERLWQRCLLQRSYFNTTLAGVEFFERLQSLKPEDNQLREIYLLVLSMGFVGQFAMERPHSEFIQSTVSPHRGWNDMAEQSNTKLYQIRKEQLRHYLSQTGHSADAQAVLFPFAYQAGDQAIDKPQPRWKKLLSRPRDVIIAVLPLIVLALYALYLNASLNKTISTFLESIGV